MLSLAGVVWGASFGSSDGVARALRSSARSLRAGGPLVVPVVHAPASMLAVSSPPSMLAVSSPPSARAAATWQVVDRAVAFALKLLVIRCRRGRRSTQRCRGSSPRCRSSVLARRQVSFEEGGPPAGSAPPPATNCFRSSYGLPPSFIPSEQTLGPLEGGSDMVLNEELAPMVRVSRGGLMLVYARHCPVAAGYLEHFYVRDSGVVEIEVDLPDSEENGVSFRSAPNVFADLAEAIEALGEYLGCTDAWSIPARCAMPEGPSDGDRQRICSERRRERRRAHFHRPSGGKDAPSCAARGDVSAADTRFIPKPRCADYGRTSALKGANKSVPVAHRTNFEIRRVPGLAQAVGLKDERLAAVFCRFPGGTGASGGGERGGDDTRRDDERDVERGAERSKREKFRLSEGEKGGVLLRGRASRRREEVGEEVRRDRYAKVLFAGRRNETLMEGALVGAPRELRTVGDEAERRRFPPVADEGVLHVETVAVPGAPAFFDGVPLAGATDRRIRLAENRIGAADAAGSGELAGDGGRRSDRDPLRVLLDVRRGVGGGAGEVPRADFLGNCGAGPRYRPTPRDAISASFSLFRAVNRATTSWSRRSSAAVHGRTGAIFPQRAVRSATVNSLSVVCEAAPKSSADSSAVPQATAPRRRGRASKRGRRSGISGSRKEWGTETSVSVPQPAL
ncbi:hypothetical protein OUZ56_033104 [Daphnia magna]|uniref:Uncharacterized protein n=1 Tax=Daphnia magna TaxID=35525 RepID=A0ABR0BAJ7_9CRUS|nr:hypothetical protein OUZ56_033104 [Daphnia magna]